MAQERTESKFAALRQTVRSHSVPMVENADCAEAWSAAAKDMYAKRFAFKLVRSAIEASHLGVTLFDFGPRRTL
jgi:hypothetical protein